MTIAELNKRFEEEGRIIIVHKGIYCGNFREV